MPLVGRMTIRGRKYLSLSPRLAIKLDSQSTLSWLVTRIQKFMVLLVADWNSGTFDIRLMLMLLDMIGQQLLL